ncbi:hypothetical protein ACFL6P_03830 [Candidatus Latescibacterota bacterium]
MLFEKTQCIDIPKLEHESRILFILGYVIGILFVASLSPFISSRIGTYIPNGQETPESNKPIRIDLIYIRPQTDIPSLPVIEPEIKEQPVAEPERQTESPSETIAETAPNREMASLMFQPADSLVFPDLTGTKNIPRHEISEPETIRMPESWVMFPEPKPEPTVTIPVEKVKDERRELKTDIFGIPLAKHVHPDVIVLARNIPNFITWKIQDIIKKRRIEKMMTAHFTTFSEKDLRLMILVWRDGLLDTRKLSKSDREFILGDNNGVSEIMTHATYLLEMEKRGIVSSLIYENNLVFRANFTRDAVLESLAYERMNGENSNKFAVLDALIGLIQAHGDSTKTEIAIPAKDNYFRRIFF